MAATTTATAPAVATSRLGISLVGRDPVDELARWLLVAMALDLFVTRFLVRLAIFVPKGEPWATVAAGLGRVGAATDALVPIVGLLLLGALLLRAGRLGSRAERAILVSLTGVAAGGLALVAFPPTPVVAIVLNLLVAATALGAAIRLFRDTRAPAIARLGLMSLGGAFVVAALGRVSDLAGVLAGPTGGWPDGSAGLAAGTLGQICFVGGAGIVGIAGIAWNARLRLSGRPDPRLAVAGVIAALVVLAAGSVAPATWGALAIWSLGLAGTTPVPVLALAAGLAVAGLPALYRRAPAAAMGGSIVLLAGYDLAASGLVLGGLLGLVVARSREAVAREPVGR